MKREHLAGHKAEHWRQHIEGWLRSGTSQREYCERHNLAVSTFQLWRQRLHRGSEPQGRFEIVPLIQASRPQPASSLALLIGDRYRLEVCDDFEPRALVTMLDVLEGRCR